MSVTREQRFARTDPCPVCGGWELMPRGRDSRCFGFKSSDGRYAHCTREEHAGALTIHPDSGTYAHRLDGPCACGNTHGAAPLPSKNGKGPRVLTQADFARCVHPYPVDYRDADGAVLYRACRWPKADGGKTYGYAHRNGTGEWLTTIGKARRVALDLPELRQAIAAGRDVVLAEGEKKTRLFQALGFAATTNDGGALHFRPEHAECLRGAVRVTVLLDNDPDGRKRGELVPPLLHAVGVPEVRVLLLPGLAEGQGADDWIAARRQAGATDTEIRAELEAMANSAPLGEPPVNPPGNPPPSPAPAARVRKFMRTDLGNGERFAAQHGTDVRYVHPWREWLVWDGRRWARDRMSEVRRRAKATVREIYIEARATEEESERKATAAHAAHSEGDSRIIAMLACAKSEPPIAAVPEQFDDPERCRYLFNCANGTLDLTTGRLRQHRREDHITKIAPVEYRAEARGPLFDFFLERIIPDTEVRAFLRRYAGSALTGDTGDQTFALLYGTGANGKSTLVEVLLSLVGDYGHNLDFETLLHATGRSDQRGAPRADLMALRGVRLAVAVEAGEGRRLDESVVKQLTGTDTMTARGLYHADQTRFRPEAKLMLVCNSRPSIHGTDLAIWRRVLEVPFLLAIPEGERDAGLADKLRTPAELSGVLAWAVSGCSEWLGNEHRRLRPPEAVIAATRAYQEAEDILAPFLAERCMFESGAWSTTKELRTAYMAWCSDNGDKRPLSPQAFGRRLRERGCVDGWKDGARGWRGIRIRYTHEGFEPTEPGAEEHQEPARGGPPVDVSRLSRFIGNSPEPPLEPLRVGVMENTLKSVISVSAPRCCRHCGGELRPFGTTGDIACGACKSRTFTAGATLPQAIGDG